MITDGNSLMRACTQPPSTGSYNAVNVIGLAIDTAYGVGSSTGYKMGVSPSSRTAGPDHHSRMCLSSNALGLWTCAPTWASRSAGQAVSDPLAGSSQQVTGKLIARGRRGRLSEITLLRDDGSGEPYGEHPARRKVPYFKVPYEFWTQEWHRQLDLPSVAVLLIGLSLNDGFVLPGDQVKRWYGISSSTLTKGLGGLRKAGLLVVKRDQKVAELAPEGHTWEYTHTLQAPFGPKGRRAARADRS